MTLVVKMNRLENDSDSNDDICVNMADLSTFEENSDGKDVELGTRPSDTSFSSKPILMKNLTTRTAQISMTMAD